MITAPPAASLAANKIATASQSNPMSDPKVIAWLNSLPEEERQAAMQRMSQDYQGKRGAMSDQMQMAQQLRNTPSAQGRQAGRVYTAANPLEHIASAYQQRKGSDMQEEALAAKKALSDEYGTGVQDVMAAMLRGNTTGAY